MKLTYKNYELELRHKFTIATNSRSITPIVLTKLEHAGLIGFGEASLPPYLDESQKSVCDFLSKINLDQFKNPFEIDEILTYVDQVEENNTAAKASVDIALHDLVGKLLNKPLHEIWEYQKASTPNTTFTIGIDSSKKIKQKIGEAEKYKILKVKLGTPDDRKIIRIIREVTNKPIVVDINQGWKCKEASLDLIYWLKENNVIIIEQPLPKEKENDLAWLTERSPLPIIADEGVQRLPDVSKCKNIYSGINIKLMKSTGLREAFKMLNVAKDIGLITMIGCMTETSCAISAASQLSPNSNWADLDGNLLIKNDPFEGTKIVDGKIILNNNPGIGLK